MLERYSEYSFFTKSALVQSQVSSAASSSDVRSDASLSSFVVSVERDERRLERSEVLLFCRALTQVPKIELKELSSSSEEPYRLDSAEYCELFEYKDCTLLDDVKAESSDK